MMYELLEDIGCDLVTHPEDFRLESSTDGDFDQYSITVHPDDFGQIIGRQGRTARALRTVARIGAARVGRRAAVEIVE